MATHNSLLFVPAPSLEQATSGPFLPLLVPSLLPIEILLLAYVCCICLTKSFTSFSAGYLDSVLEHVAAANGYCRILFSSEGKTRALLY